uniref:5'-nucleotidase domain-containing protein 3 isoform X1 n=3 Tax=Ictidomys tridecemlineatus TaxID=43179 RepID=UPI00038C12E4|nr:5'-nucleotidase domain-containing protein 3 isoform X1 [Ictidomys tridecemlineatus]XP_040135001.1 5'-nucleotidase domain-containing protein 3 isoform X1 [Ictidomys tridecemlineatus]XP_040135004.1 5'-nucleotidase domain-containing protein 3 isoform X1 [Ictidomys tridecemlineatus]XP_040135006.1 5'-nucleotidase domain-containing protein 3 isoform X1 [Ictidomys tridecemlineatus]
MNQKANENVERVAQFIVKPQTPIRPYICSTLNDFQEERNFLATNIFPQLNELCNSRGTYFKPVDLRWSVLKAQKSLPANLYRQGCCLLSQQLKLCLDYVNSCFPFFICMLGQTYGDFFPDHSPFMFSKAKDLSNLSKAEQNLYVAAKNGYPWVLETPNCSLTEFEIIQAAFRNQSQFQYFYFRTRTTLLKILSGEEEESLSSGALVNEEEKLKIGRLKAKIISKGLPIRFYKDLQELGELVFKDWSFVIEKLNPITLMIKNIDYRHSLECFYHEEFIEKCKQAFVSSKESNRIFEILEQFVLKDEGLDLKNAAADSNLVSVLRINSLPAFKSILLLSGERGCGKSTLIANFVNYFKNKYPSIWIIPHFVGSTCESSDIVSVIHYFITELQHKNHNMQPEMDFLNEDSNILSFSLLVEVFIASISLKPCILVLDGIEELIGIYGISGQKAKDFSWLPHSLPPHCKFILSTVSSSLSCKLLCARADVKIVELTSVGDEDTRLSIFRQHLFTPGQDPSLHSRLALKKKPSLSPLKLTVLANELKECRIYRSELQCLKEYLEVASLQEFWELILKRWTEDYSWTIKQKKAKPDNGTSEEGLDGWVADALCLLCISNCGMAEDELLQVLDTLGYRNNYKVTTVHWAAFRNATKQWVQEKPNGVLYFRHQSLRSAVESKLLGITTPVRESSPNACQNPMNLKKTHFHLVLVRYFQQQNTFWRVFQELPWHMKMSGCLGALCSFLTNPSITDFISKIQSSSFWTRLYLIHYWNVLSEAGYNTSRAYLMSVASIKADQCHKVKRRQTLSVLEWKLSNVTATDKCRLMFCIGSFLKLMGKIREAKELFLSTEDMLMQSQSTREMLLKAQNAIGELYVEIGNTQEGFKYFQKAWSNLQCLPLSDFKDNRNLMKQKVRVLNNLAKWASEEYLKENHVLEYATEVSKLVDNIPHDQATMKYTEGVLMLVDGNTYLAKMKFQECLRIRRSLFGEKNMLVGEIMEILADLLFFLLTDNEKLQRKQVIEYYKQVIKIKENADALANSSLVRKQLSISLSDTLCKLAGYLLTSDSCHHVMIEAIGYLYRSLDLRETYLGPSHSSIHGIMHLLKEIERTRSRKFWPLGMLQQSPESSKNGSLLWEHLLKLDYHSAQSSNTVSSVMRINAAKLTRAKSLQLAPHQISDKSKYAIRKKISSPIICISAGKKTQEKVQNNVEIWDSPRKEASKKKKDYSIEVLPSGKKSGLVKLSKQRILSDESMSGAGHVTTIYHSPLLGPFTTNDSWHSISELISEKWLFHNPDYNWTPPKSILKRKSQVETKSLKNSTNKE